jgi:RimJ/RimL family protein N-acetyltransferase
LLDPANNYFVANDAAGHIVGYCCYGPDARVAGGDYRDPVALDVGLGMRPNLTGRGAGVAFVVAVLAFGRERFGASRFRLSVAAFNRRAIRVYERAGFRETGRFRRGGSPDGLEFVMMVEDAR